MTPAQYKLLAALEKGEEVFVYHRIREPDGWHTPVGTTGGTVRSCEKKGWVALQQRESRSVYSGRYYVITRAGKIALASAVAPAEPQIVKLYSAEYGRLREAQAYRKGTKWMHAEHHYQLTGNWYQSKEATLKHAIEQEELAIKLKQIKIDQYKKLL